jgi:transglutaminase-like putative cysteine protease
MIKRNGQPKRMHWQLLLRNPRFSPNATSNVTGSRARARTVVALFVAILLATSVLSLRAGEADPAASFVSSPASVSFDFSYVVRVEPPAGSRKVRVWIPLPSSDQYQTISQLQLKGPMKVQLHKEPTYGDRYAYFDVDSSRVKPGFEIRLAFHVVRHERRSALASTSIVDSTGRFPKDVVPFLQADGLVPVDGMIASLSREQTQGVSDPLQKARRIYDYVISVVNHDTVGADSGRGDALWAAESHHGDCTDVHSLFIGMARAAGIPARLAVGFSLPEGQKQGTIPSYHSWAEFYMSGLGWIPVDAWKDSQDPSNRDDLFGALDAHRVMVSMGRDVALTPAPQVGRLRYIAYPYLEVDGKPSPVTSMDVFFNAPGFQSAAPTVFRHPIFARAIFPVSRLAS